MNEYVCLDIETLNSTGRDLEIELSLVKPAANIKDQKKKEANINAKKKSIVEKAALQESSPIGCIGVKDDSGNYNCFTSFDRMEAQEVDILKQAGIFVQQSESEEGMLCNFSDFVDENYDSETEVITFNGYRFDLPKMRGAYARNDVSIPQFMGKRQPGIDLMIQYCKYFSIDNSFYISMSEVVQRLNICGGKKVSGALFPELIEQGRYLEAVIYNSIDNLLAEQIYLRMFK